MNDWFRKPKINRITFGFLRNLMMMSTGGIVLIAVILGIGLLRQGNRFFEGLKSVFNVETASPQADITSLIVRQIRGASELTTAVFTMEAVVPAHQDRSLAGYKIGTTTLLYIAYGEVRAGVDLKELSANNVQVVNNNVQLQLPPPRILDSKIDVNRSRVYDYDRGFLGLGPDTAPQLQMFAQQETLKRIVTAACSQGVLQQANDRAELVVTQLLNTAGYKNVAVTTQSPRPGTCQ